MSSRRNQGNYGSPSYNDRHNGPPPLRQPNLSSQQVLAAVKLGFNDKHNYSGGGSSNGRGGADTSGFPEIGQFSAEDYEVTATPPAQTRQNNYSQHDDRDTQQYPGQEEGLLRPLRRPHTDEIPPGKGFVLGMILWYHFA